MTPATWEERERRRREQFACIIAKYSTDHLQRIGERGAWANGQPLRPWELDDLRREYLYRLRREQTKTWPHEAELRLYGLA